MPATNCSKPVPRRAGDGSVNTVWVDPLSRIPYVAKDCGTDGGSGIAARQERNDKRSKAMLLSRSLSPGNLLRDRERAHQRARELGLTGQTSIQQGCQSNKSCSKCEGNQPPTLTQSDRGNGAQARARDTSKVRSKGAAGNRQPMACCRNQAQHSGRKGKRCVVTLASWVVASESPTVR